MRSHYKVQVRRVEHYDEFYFIPRDAYSQGEAEKLAKQMAQGIAPAEKMQFFELSEHVGCAAHIEAVEEVD